MRDFQRSKVYAAEEMAAAVMDREDSRESRAYKPNWAGICRMVPDNEPAKIKILFDQAMAYDNGKAHLQFSEKARHSETRWKSAYSRRPTVVLCRPYSIVDLLHEVAHATLPAGEHHSPRWCWRYIRLVDRFLGVTASRALRNAFVVKGVKVVPS